MHQYISMLLAKGRDKSLFDIGGSIVHAYLAGMKESEFAKSYDISWSIVSQIIKR